MKRIVSVFLLLTSFSIYAQKSDCIVDFEYLVKKIKNDYPGYKYKTQNEKQKELLLLEDKTRKRIIACPDSCFAYIREYADFFKDKHLRIQRVWPDSKVPLKRMDVSTYGRNVKVNFDSLRIANISSSGLEGVWKGSWGEFAVIRTDSNKYVGIAINVDGWNSGQVMYEFVPFGNSEFNLIQYSLIEGSKTVMGKASLHVNGKILEIHDDAKYVRKSNSPAFDEALRNSYLQSYPNGRNTYWLDIVLGDSTVYLRLPNFMSENVEKLVKKHWNDITSRPNLIIDIRNNGGGQDNFYQILLELIYTKPYESKGVEWYATDGIIKMYEDAIRKGDIKNGEEGLTWTNALLNEMRKNKGGFVIHPMMGKDKIIKRDTVYKYPSRVGIIINENNASSAEQFLLAAKNSDKVILFGNRNTMGVLDYSNAVSELLPSGNFKLIYPLTRSRRLPDNPIDNIGIAPDVIIPYDETIQLFNRLDNWVYFVQEYLEYKER